MINRPLVKSEYYHEHLLEARFMGPDLLSFVDSVELPQFYVDVEAALLSGRKFIDAQEKEERERLEADAYRK